MCIFRTYEYKCHREIFIFLYLVVDFCFIPKSTAKVIWSRNLGLKSHSKDWKKPRLEPNTLGIQVDSLTTTPEKLIAVGPAFDTV